MISARPTWLIAKQPPPNDVRHWAAPTRSAGEDVADRSHARAGRDVGARPDVVGRVADLVGQAVGPIEDEDLRIAHHCTPVELERIFIGVRVSLVA